MNIIMRIYGWKNISTILATAALPIFFSNTVFAQQCTTPPANMVGWWRGESNNADFIHGNDGTNSGPGSYVAGEVGSAFSLNSAGSGIVIPNSPLFQVQDFTIEAWVQRNSSSRISSDN